LTEQNLSQASGSSALLMLPQQRASLCCEACGPTRLLETTQGA